MLRGDHRRHGFALHDPAERDRLRIRFPVIHAHAHVRVERQILHPKQNLPGAWRRDRGFLVAEIGQLGSPLRSGSKHYLEGFSLGHIDTSIACVDAHYKVWYSIERKTDTLAPYKNTDLH